MINSEFIEVVKSCNTYQPVNDGLKESFEIGSGRFTLFCKIRGPFCQLIFSNAVNDEEIVFSAIDEYKEELLKLFNAESICLLTRADTLQPLDYLKLSKNVLYGKFVLRVAIEYYGTEFVCRRSLIGDTRVHRTFEDVATMLKEDEEVKEFEKKTFQKTFQIVEFFNEFDQVFSLDQTLTSSVFKVGFMTLQLKANSVEMDVLDNFFGPLI